MTGEVDDNEDEPRTAGEKERRTYWGEEMISIGQALQRAAGFPASGPLLCRENPWLAGSGGAHPPILDTTIKKILYASVRIPGWRNPRAAEAELQAVRSDIKRLRNRLAWTEENTDDYGFDLGSYIDLNGDPGPLTELIADDAKAQAELEAAIEADPGRAFAPYEDWTVPVALSALEKLDAAIVLTIEEAIEASAQLPKTGRIPNVVARDVAYVVARYVRDVTGDIPGLTTKPVVTGPFALALKEIFEILDIKAEVQRPGEYAISKLSENSEICP